MSTEVAAAALDVDKNIDRIERLIATGGGADASLEARRLFRECLLRRLPDAHETATIADAVREMAETPGSFQFEAAYLVRYLSVPNLLPLNNKSNNLHRYIVALVEGALPPLCSYFNLQNYKLTNQKRAIAESW